MTKTMLSILAVLSIAVAGAVLLGSRGVAGDTPSAAGTAAAVVADAAPPRGAPPRHDSPPSASGNLVVELCDGQTAAEIPGVKEGETPTRAQAQAVVDRLMREWQAKHPDEAWEMAPMRVAQANAPGAAPANPAGVAPANPAGAAPANPAGRAPANPAGAAPANPAGPPPANAPGPAPANPAAPAPLGTAVAPPVPQGAVQSGQTYGAFSERDERLWKAETERFIQEGHDVFHDAKAFGGTIGVSCDMCHPDAANTHPETYPKFQVQLGRVALLRDMINWCIQNPTRGKPLPEDDPRLKAMEAYILAQRKATPLEFGKH
jgi:hypothetical protein